MKAEKVDVVDKLAALIEQEMGVVVLERSLTHKRRQIWNSEDGDQVVFDLDFHAWCCTIPKKKKRKSNKTGEKQ